MEKRLILKMIKKLVILIFFFFISLINAQNNYPMILNFEVSNEISNNGEVGTDDAEYYFLLINSQKAVDLKKYGNKEVQFKMMNSNANSVILEYQQPSKLIPKGRCAAGIEKGYLYLEFDNDANLIISDRYIIDSCLLSIESTIESEDAKEKIKIICENYQTSESYVVVIDKIKVKISKE